jgi:2-C-methyl-D-erythritol 4-phosphate cytidylyltransferase
MSASAIILAGGTGERFGKKKQLIEFQNKPLWKHVYDKCIEADVFTRLVIVGIPYDEAYETVSSDDGYLGPITDIFWIDKGGKTRQESVFYGLHKIGDVDRVVILEAARPLITVEQIQTMAEHEGRSVSYVAPAVETILFRGEHLDRNACEILQVPQSFDANMLTEAHMMTCVTDATDDTILMWKVHKIEPDLIPGGRNLHKVTFPHDIRILEHIHEDINNRR